MYGFPRSGREQWKRRNEFLVLFCEFAVFRELLLHELEEGDVSDDLTAEELESASLFPSLSSVLLDDVPRDREGEPEDGTEKRGDQLSTCKDSNQIPRKHRE